MHAYISLPGLKVNFIKFTKHAAFNYWTSIDNGTLNAVNSIKFFVSTKNDKAIISKLYYVIVPVTALINFEEPHQIDYLTKSLNVR